MMLEGGACFLSPPSSRSGAPLRDPTYFTWFSEGCKKDLLLSTISPSDKPGQFNIKSVW